MIEKSKALSPRTSPRTSPLTSPRLGELNPGHQRRVKHDMHQIKASGIYQNMDFEEVGNGTRLAFDRITDRASVLMHLPELYPFRPPQVYINRRKAALDWRGPGDRIVSVLERHAASDSVDKVLVLCHFTHIDGDFENVNGHWLGELGADECGESVYRMVMRTFGARMPTGRVTFHTVDNSPSERNNATFREDAFSSAFVDDHPLEYDAILVPDCGGIWYLTIYEQSTVAQKEQLLEACVDMLRMLKPNGLIFFSKLSSEFQAALKGRLEQAGCTISDALFYGVGRCLVARVGSGLHVC